MTVVLGGGISGLSAAYYLLRLAKHKVTVIEGSNRIGGWMRSVKLPNTDIVFEKGPRTIRPHGLQGLNTLSLIEELGLSDRLVSIPRNHPVAKNRLLYVKNKLHTLPNSISAFFKITPPFSRPLILALMKDFLTPRKVTSDESIYDFVKRRFGKDLAEFIIRPMICGICAGDAKEISVKFLMQSLFDAEQKYGSVSRGLMRGIFFQKENIPEDLKQSELCKQSRNENWSVWYLHGGLQLLPDTLKDYLQEKHVELILNSKCTKLTFVDSKVVCKFGNNETVYEHVVSALPAHKLAPMLSHQHPFLSENLSAIPTVDVAVVSLAFKGNLNKENAFGFLTSPLEELPVLGVIFDSDCFDYKDWTVLTVMMGGKWFHKYFGSTVTDENLLNTALENVSKILNITDKPCYHHVSVLKNCIPQYVVGHYERIDKIFKYIKNENLPLSLVGSSYKGVGINDVIMSSKTAVSQIKV